MHLTRHGVAQFRRHSSQPMSWHCTEETKPNTIKASNTGIKRFKLIPKNTKNTIAKRTKKRNLNLSQYANLRSVYLCVHVTVHNCCTQYSTEQFWLFSILTSRQSSQLWCCLLKQGVTILARRAVSTADTAHAPSPAAADQPHARRPVRLPASSITADNRCLRANNNICSVSNICWVM